MSDFYYGEIRPVAFDWAPEFWALCRGQLQSINQNPALYTVISDYYGGNGQTTFAMPDLVGRAPMHWGIGPGLTPRFTGEKGGQFQVTLSYNEMASHQHTMFTRFDTDPNFYTDNPHDAYLNRKGFNSAYIFNNTPPGIGQLEMASANLAPTGENEAHENRQPYLAINFVIALFGTYPPRP